MMHKRVALLVATLAAACAVTVTAVTAQEGGGAKSADAKLRDASGKAIGTVQMRQRGDSVEVTVSARRLSTGFHGFHVHETGVCKAPSMDDGESGAFLSAGGHHAKGDQSHGEHAGDMPSLVATDAKRAKATFVLDSFRVADLVKGDGSAVMIHADRDNFANIPGRYKDGGPDKETLDTGDAGDRLACGVVKPD